MGRRSSRAGKLAAAALVLIAAACGWVGQRFYQNENSPPIENTSYRTEPGGKLPPRISDLNVAREVYLAFGNPSNARADGTDRNNYLIVNTAYAESYNNSLGRPNWVAWRLTESDIGGGERSNDFRPNEQLPFGWKHVLPSDYTDSGYDRGHLCPSGDRSADPDQNSLTFLMTNVAPQTPDLNRYPWEKLETYARGLVRRGHVDLYIIAGVYGNKGKLKRGVSVPTNFWKVIVAVPQGGDPSSVTSRTHVIAVDMPNVSGIASDSWRKYTTTVRAIEQKTGYDLLSGLSREVQDDLETKGEAK